MRAEEQLAWEARQRPKAALAALASAVMTAVASVWSALAFSDAPRSGLLNGLERAAEPGPVATSPSLRLPYYEFFDSHSTEVLATAVLRGLALAGIGIALAFLAAATRFRRTELPRFAPTLAAVGALLSALATVLTAVATVIAVRDLLEGPRSVDAVDDLGRGSFLVTSQLIGLPGTLALSIALVIICLNAMRAGLLTRFMGVLGIIVGVLIVFPIGSPIPVVQIVWLLALGLLFLGRVPRGVPPAWSTGQAEPWPTAVDRRMEQKAREEPREPRTAAAPNPATSKKKRKRRR